MGDDNMASQTITREKVIELIDELPAEILPEAVQFVEYLRFKANRSQAAPPSENVLLAVINRRLPPADQARLDDLRARNELGTISDSERSELLAFVERVEREDAERAEALVELARLRGLPLATLIRELKIDSNVI